ncbi:MAG: A/G-specific adenine glycosylase [Acidobacteriota bacterium]
MLEPAEFRRALLRWYRKAKRDLPWRLTRDPYRIWLSEVMLQQTRVAAALPYYERFLQRFPDAATLARAPEAEVLAAWAGLGYYSRARNVHKAAKLIAHAGFPRDYDGIRALPGVGDYTAAAVASIAFDLPHAVLDGNVMRVLARVTNDDGRLDSSPTRTRLRDLAAAMLDRKRPGEHNQALMELGATVCLPGAPLCLVCPVAAFCEARRLGREGRLPVKSRPAEPLRLELQFLVVRRNGSYLLRRRPADSGRMAGFWELPEPAQLPGTAPAAALGSFRHTITHHHYTVTVFEAEAPGAAPHIPPDFEWIPAGRLHSIPLSTLARKALARAAGR